MSKWSRHSLSQQKLSILTKFDWVNILVITTPLITQFLHLNYDKSRYKTKQKYRRATLLHQNYRKKFLPKRNCRLACSSYTIYGIGSSKAWNGLYISLSSYSPAIVMYLTHGRDWYPLFSIILRYRTWQKAKNSIYISTLIMINRSFNIAFIITKPDSEDRMIHV